MLDLFEIYQIAVGASVWGMVSLWMYGALMAARHETNPTGTTWVDAVIATTIATVFGAAGPIGWVLCYAVTDRAKHGWRFWPEERGVFTPAPEWPSDPDPRNDSAAVTRHQYTETERVVTEMCDRIRDRVNAVVMQEEKNAHKELVAVGIPAKERHETINAMRRSLGIDCVEDPFHV